MRRLLVLRTTSVMTTLLSALLILGCQPAEPNIPSTNQPPVAAKVQSDTKSAGEVVPSTQINVTRNLEPTTTGDYPFATEPTPMIENPPLRTLWLTRDRPVLIEWRLSLDGQPWRDTSQQLVERLIRESDRDHDRRTTWDEFLSDERYQRGQLGTASFALPRQRKDLVFERDIDADGTVDVAELMALLHPGQHHAEPLNWRADETLADEPLAPLLRQCDLNDDGVWSHSEIEAIQAGLVQRDADDDGWITRREWDGSRPNAGDTSNPTKSPEGTPSLFVVHPQRNWEQLLFQIEGYYSQGNSLRADDFGEPAAFVVGDVDANGSWDAEELAQVCGRPADVVVDVAMGVTIDRPVVAHAKPSSRINGSLEPERVEIRAVDVGVLRNDPEAQLVLSLGADQLQIILASDRSLADERRVLEKSWQELLVAMSLHDSVDANQFAPLQGTVGVEFPGVDVNHDQQVSWSEVLQAWEQRQSVARSRVAISVTESSDRLWTLIDRDGDSKLSAREQKEATAALHRCADASGNVLFDTIPHQTRFEIRRDMIERPTDAQLVSRDVISPPVPSPSTPNWFRAWDRNRDGDVSREEFLGTSQQFEQLDRNHNQLWESSELP